MAYHFDCLIYNRIHGIGRIWVLDPAVEMLLFDGNVDGKNERYGSIDMDRSNSN